jgi:hypothetical protein
MVIIKNSTRTFLNQNSKKTIPRKKKKRRKKEANNY